VQKLAMSLGVNGTAARPDRLTISSRWPSASPTSRSS
jgi:hypothetical protein